MRDGVINILKAPGMTSNDVVYDVRRALSIKRVGHTGTLDPGACGVLPICVGKATRLFDYLVEKEKEYITEVVFSKETDTLDAYGRITNSDSRIVNAKDIENVIPMFLGEIEQLAPMYSAVSVNGQRLYKLARKGIEVERKVRTANIYALEMLRDMGENKFLFRVRCSKGTYVRTLFNDMAHKMGTFCYVSFLLRSASGMFTLENSVTLQELCLAKDNGDEDKYILPIADALYTVPQMRFENDAYIKKLLLNGASIDNRADDALYRVYYDDVFVGIGEQENDRLHIKTQFCEDGI